MNQSNLDDNLRKLQTSLALLHETEQVASDTLTNLKEQRETLQNVKANTKANNTILEQAKNFIKKLW